MNTSQAFDFKSGSICGLNVDALDESEMCEGPDYDLESTRKEYWPAYAWMMRSRRDLNPGIELSPACRESSHERLE